MNLITHLHKQRDWARDTFGPGPRSEGILDHIRKELLEIEADPNDIYEWIDVVILALDGAMVSGHTPQQVSDALAEKLSVCMARKWPDWRTAPKGKAIEHVRH